MAKQMKRNVESPNRFCEATIKRIERIDSELSVLGVMFLMNGFMEMYTVPENMWPVLAKRLPPLNDAMYHAVMEIDILDELVAYRIETKKIEILVVADREFASVVVHKVKKEKRRKNKPQQTSHINAVNPIVDRLMEDESVSGVIMTNMEGLAYQTVQEEGYIGNPVLTNTSLTLATRYGTNLHRYGIMAQNYVKELDPFDEVMVVRLKTPKIEMMLAPNREFSIIVVQHARLKGKNK